MGGKSSPPVPDYRGAAEQQSQASQQIAAGQTFANRPSITTPWGGMNWQTAPYTDPATGFPVTQWSGNLSLSPDTQAALQSQQDIQRGRSQAAQTLLGQATAGFEQPFDWSSLPAAPGSLQGAQTGAYQTMSQMLEPGRTRERAGLENQLANMGLTRGSEAWNVEMQNQANRFAQQDKQLMGQALAEGRADVGTQQGLRQAAIGEQAQRRSMTLNELNALLTGQQVGMPQMPQFMGASAGQAPNLFGAAGQQFQSGLQAQQAGPDIGSLVGTAGMLAGAAMMMSDVRLKRDLLPVGRTPRGLTLYAFRMNDDIGIGISAQEAALKAPHLVAVLANGLLAVSKGGW